MSNSKISPLQPCIERSHLETSSPAPAPAPATVSETKEHEGRTPKDQEDYIVQADCKQYNVLMIGDSGAGKTTFVEILKDISYRCKRELYRGTKNPKSHYVSVKYKGQPMSITLIDTPGFHETDGRGQARDDHTIANTIKSFVKKDVTKIHMILITANISNRLNADDLNSIEAVLDTLGKDLKKNICLLLTNFENMTEGDEQAYRDMVKNDEPLKYVNMMCKMGVLFTGALSQSQYDDVRIRDAFISKQKRRLCEFLDKLQSAEESELLTDGVKKITSMLKVTESSIDKIRQMEEMIPEIDEGAAIARNERVRLSKLMDDMKETDKHFEASTNLIEKAGRLEASRERLDETLQEISETKKQMNLDNERIQELYADLAERREYVSETKKQLQQLVKIIRAED